MCIFMDLNVTLRDHSHHSLLLQLRGKKDSLFYDSALSDVGLKQAFDLHKHMQTPVGHAFFTNSHLYVLRKQKGCKNCARLSPSHEIFSWHFRFHLRNLLFMPNITTCSAAKVNISNPITVYFQIGFLSSSTITLFTNREMLSVSLKKFVFEFFVIMHMFAYVTHRSLG